jgi:hypothetical protein
VPILFLKLLAAHCLADYPLQGDFLARAKNHRAPIGGVPWVQALAAHAVIQGGAVWLVTGSLALGAFETFAHALIDFGKNQGWYGYHADQFLHVACKALYVLLPPRVAP